MSDRAMGTVPRRDSPPHDPLVNEAEVGNKPIVTVVTVEVEVEVEVE
eukprot:CAMPEP_0174241162 /NCGR_PEP_ID=MMETSP0417-20130205/22047_1 /TAXON_ID=242541 /ORGANISM="Mayorella sp, Strain BSH-02190019" /LENGTH=46 /DNA_ID= /DNA_START= /DNA_END= /DNA_ORIENTATION=